VRLPIVPRREEHVLIFGRARGELVLTLRLPHVVDLVRPLFLPLLFDLLVELFVAGLPHLEVLAAAAQLRQV